MAAGESTSPAKTAPPPAGAAANLAAQATNPVANLMQFQIQNEFNWSNYNSSGSSNAFIIQPVIPIPLPWEAVPLVITRTTIPYLQRQLDNNLLERNGLGSCQAKSARNRGTPDSSDSNALPSQGWKALPRYPAPGISMSNRLPSFCRAPI